jgi:hypothetical protein
MKMNMGQGNAVSTAVEEAAAADSRRRVPVKGPTGGKRGSANGL